MQSKLEILFISCCLCWAAMGSASARAADAPPEEGEEAKSAPPLYTVADNATLRRERARLKEERKDLKAQKKAQKIEVKSLDDRVDRIEEQFENNPDDPGLTTELGEAEASLKQAEQELDATKDRLSANRQAKRETHNFLIFPFGAPSYTPELQLLVTVGALMSFKTNRLDPELQRSSVNFTAGYSSNNSLILYDKITSFWFSDWLRLEQEFWFKDMPDNYWGAGYDAGHKYSDPNEHTEYHRTWWDVSATATGRVWVDNLYAGVKVNFNRTVGKDMNPTMQEDPYVQEFGGDNYNGGIGAIIRYDSRDVAVNAFKGLYLSAEGLFFGSFFGSDNNFQRLDFDYRHYLTLGRPGSTLAWRIQTPMHFGDVPWAELSQIGNPFDLRGYRWGRFRDNTTLLGLLEYRLQFKRIWQKPGKSVLSPHGAILWVGTGSLGEDYTEMTNWLPNGGVGYRLELQPRMNMRLDMGFGAETFAIYFNFLESF